ncbi:hypothetical protein J6590_035284 [Homalodisca vitripennis]|nr:hypothetical protein J6590_035284 [Homalodisca vitripennis]
MSKRCKCFVLIFFVVDFLWFSAGEQDSRFQEAKKNPGEGKASTNYKNSVTFPRLDELWVAAAAGARSALNRCPKVGHCPSLEAAEQYGRMSSTSTGRLVTHGQFRSQVTDKRHASHTLWAQGWALFRFFLGQSPGAVIKTVVIYTSVVPSIAENRYVFFAKAPKSVTS